MTILVWACVREMTGSDLGQGRGYPDWFFAFFLIPSKKIPGYDYLKYDHDASFQIISNQLLIQPLDAL
jgi:hypothetical protein